MILKFIKRIYIGLLFIALIVLGYYGFVFYQQLPKPTYELRSDPVLLTPHVRVGEAIRWQVDICKFHDKEFYVERVLKNLTTKREFPPLEQVPSSNKPLAKGECRVAEASQLVPDNQPLGEYQLITRVFVKQNRYSVDKFEYVISGITIN